MQCNKQQTESVHRKVQQHITAQTPNTNQWTENMLNSFET